MMGFTETSEEMRRRLMPDMSGHVDHARFRRLSDRLEREGWPGLHAPELVYYYKFIWFWQTSAYLEMGASVVSDGTCAPFRRRADIRFMPRFVDAAILDEGWRPRAELMHALGS